MTRNEALLAGVNLDVEIGLEIGPLASPIVARAPGRRIFYADYASREDLAASETLYAGQPASDLVDLDYVISPLPPTLDVKFDYILASHVVEHVPDLYGFLSTVLGWLAEGGRLILAVPDKRYTFDYLRPLSTVGEVLQAFVEGRSSPPFSAVFDTYWMAVDLDVQRAWNEEPYQGPVTRTFDLNLAMSWAMEVHDKRSYRDCHCWVFTYPSFLTLIRELNQTGLSGVIELERHAAPVHGANEFHVVLKAGRRC